MTTVVDASAYLDLLLDVIPAKSRGYFDTDLAAPDLLFVEVGAGLARAARRGLIDDARAQLLVEELLVAPIDIVAGHSLVSRALELRHNLSVYDACYVAVAEQLGCGLLTADGRLARAPGITVAVTLV
ncbi:MAG: type II toxin-antitoxin system VapC family toxin [Acidimicrobiia bacterium]